MGISLVANQRILIALTRSHFMSNTNSLRTLYSLAAQRTSVLSGLKVAAIVGTIVNIVNQGNFLFSGDFSQLSPLKVAFTYSVPFFVSIYNGTVMRLRFDPGVRAPSAANLTCTYCGNIEQVDEGDIVPDCPSCHEKGLHNCWSRSKSKSE